MSEVGTVYNVDFGDALKGFDRIGAANELLVEGFRQSGQVAQQAFAQAAGATQQYEKRLDAILAETRQSGTATRQFAGEVAGLVKEIRDVAAAQEASRRAAAAAADERRKASAAAREAARVEKQAAKELEQAQKELARAAKEAAKASEDTSKKSVGGFSAIKGAIAGLGIGAAIASFKEFANNVIETGRAADATLGKLRFANGGNIQAAARDLAFVRNEADRLGLELNSTGNSYGSFTAAASAANFPLSEARRLFLATAGASAELKLSAEDNQGVLLAFTQILSKGNVQAEELRGQIGERLPGAFAIAARAMGVTEKELNKLLETGQVASIDFLPKFARELEKTFGDGSATAAEAFGANLNRIDNEFKAFYLRFQGTAGGIAGAAAGLFKNINERLDTRTEAGREALGAKNAQQGIKQYQEFVELLFGQVAAAAKRGGRDVNTEIRQAVEVQAAELKRQAAVAEENIKTLRLPRQGGFLNDADPRTDAFLRAQGRKFDISSDAGSKNAVRLEEIVQQTAKKRAEGQLALLEQLSSARLKASDNEASALGRIEALRKKIAQEQKDRDTAPDTVPGNALRKQLIAQLVIDNKLLDELLGKVERVKKARAEVDKLTPALLALEQARARLTETAAAAIGKESDDAAERARLTFEKTIRAANRLEAELKRREAAVAKAGGKGSRADGLIDGVQAEQLTALKLAALDQYYTELYAITEAREQRLFDLRQDSAQKEVEAVDRKYDQRLKKAKDAQEREAVELARQAEQLALKTRQEQDRINRTATTATSNAQAVGATFGAGTGVSGRQALLTEKQALLAIEKKAAEDSLNNTLNKTNQEGEIERAALRAQLARIAQQQKDLDAEAKRSKFDIYALVLGDSDDPEGRGRQALQAAVDITTSAISQILQAEQQAAATKANNATTRLSELGSQIAAEIALRNEGSASNIRGLLEEQKEQRQIRRDALAEQRKLAREQIIFDTLIQASSVATAVAKALADLPVPLNLIAAGLTVGAFVAAKARAFSAASEKPEGFFRGGYTGSSTGDLHEERGPVHAKEFVFDNQKTAMYRHELLEPLHLGRPQDIDWQAPQMRALLPDHALPGQLQNERAAAQVHLHQHSFAPIQSNLDRMENRLAAIEATNAQMASQPTATTLADGRVLLRYANGSTDVVNIA